MTMTRAQRDRARIAQDTAAFLAAGGSVQRVPANMSRAAEERFETDHRGVPHYVKRRKVQPGATQ